MAAQGALRTLCAIILVATFPPVSLASPIRSLEGAINKAGHQRMLAQRLTKGFLMVGLGIQARQGQAVMRESLSIADMELASLKRFAPNDEARIALGRLERAWTGLKQAASQPATRNQALLIYDISESVQNEAHRLTLIFENAARGSSDRLVNVAGRQRMLSQRMAKYYLFRLWGINTAAAQMELDMASAEFSSGIQQLYAAQLSNPDIKAALNRLDADWRQYRELLSVIGREGAAPVVFASESVLVSCEALVALFEQQAGK